MVRLDIALGIGAAVFAGLLGFLWWLARIAANGQQARDQQARVRQSEAAMHDQAQSDQAQAAAAPDDEALDARLAAGQF